MIQSNLNNKKAGLFSVISMIATMYGCSNLRDTSFFGHTANISANIFFAIIVFALYFFYYKVVINKVCNFSKQTINIGVLAGVVNVLGRNFMLYNGMQFFSNDISFAVVFSLLSVAGYACIYASVFELGWYCLKKQKKKSLEKRNNFTFFHSINVFVFDKHPLLYPFILIVFFWLPYLISFFPGMLQWDAVNALLGYYGIIVWSNHHPVIGTLLMGYIMDIGKYFGDDNIGCTIYVMLQFLFLSIVLSYNFVFFNTWRIPYYIRWFALLIFMFHPVFPTFAMTEVKDVFYYVAYLWLLFLFIKCFERYDKFSGFYIVIATMFVCALRKEGIILCVLCLVLLLLFKDKVYEEWTNVFNSIIMGCILAMVLSYGALLYYNVGRASMTEALSIPFQQTARYIRDYREDITDSEWKILNSVFQNKANQLGYYYKPDISDPVKEYVDYNITKKQMTAYFTVWLRCFFRHPECYLSAAFNQMYGYFYIDKEAMYKIGDCRTENFVKGEGSYSEQLKIVDNPRTLNLRKTMKRYVYSWPDLPLLGLLYHPALYTWILLFGLSCLIRLKRYKYLFLYCMPLAVLCICCLSPVNAFIRYSYPIIISCFILAIFNFRLVSCEQ